MLPVLFKVDRSDALHPSTFRTLEPPMTRLLLCTETRLLFTYVGWFLRAQVDDLHVNADVTVFTTSTHWNNRLERSRKQQSNNVCDS